MDDIRNKVDYDGFEVKPDLNAHILNQAGIDLSPVDDLFNMQKRINVEVDPEWMAKKYGWKIAILVELIEGIDSLAWKWWKKSKNDRINFEIEMIDALFFTIAKIIEMQQEESTKLFFFNFMLDDQNNPKIAKNIDDVAKEVVSEISGDFLRVLALDHYLAIIPAWFKVWNMIGNDTTKAFKLYKLKFVLNMFRQQHGYKTGEYVKIWFGEEDNKVAVKLAETILFDDKYEENLTAALELEYEKVLADSNIKTPDENKTFEQFIQENQKYNLLYAAMPEEVKKLLKEFSNEYSEFKVK